MIINVHFDFTPVGEIRPSVQTSYRQAGVFINPGGPVFSPSDNPPVSSSVFINAEALMKMYREQGSTGFASVLDTIFSSAPLLQKSLELTAKELQIKDQEKLIFGIW